MERPANPNANRGLRRGVVVAVAANLLAAGFLAHQRFSAESDDVVTSDSVLGATGPLEDDNSAPFIEVTTTTTEATTPTAEATTTTTTEQVPASTTIPGPEQVPPSGLPEYINRGPADKPFVSITIDDFEGSADSGCITTILRIGQEKGVHFTFFPTGNAIEKHAHTGVFQRILDGGHEIGNHTHDHEYHMDEWPIDKVRSQLSSTQDALNAALGTEHKMTLMRPPGGFGGQRDHPDPEMTQVLREQGMSLVMWTSDPTSAPFKDLPNPEQAYIDSVTTTATNGENLLLHCQSFNMETYLPPLIDALTAKGLTPTTVTGMFQG